MPDRINEMDYRSEEVQEILERVPNWMIRWGSVLFFSLIILVLTITYIVKYPDIIFAEAMVTTKVPPEKEYARFTGKLDEILVYDGQWIQAETPLAIIENPAHYEDVLFLKNLVDSTALEKDGFYFPLEQLPILMLGEVEADFAVFESAYEQYLLNRQLQPYSSKAKTNRINLSQLRIRLQNLKVQFDLGKSELEFKKNDMERNRTLFDKGVISEQEFENKQLEYLKAERGLRDIALNISQTREDIANTNFDSTNNEVNRTTEESRLLRGVFQSMNQLKKSIRNWELKYVLRSRINGKVTFLNYWAEGQTVNEGDLVFTVIPGENSKYIAKLRAPSLNSGKIKNGQTVNIKLENYPSSEFGMLQGIIESISLIPDSEGFYLIDVSLPQKLVTNYNKEIVFKQEMRAQAEIITEDLRLIERLFYQFRKALRR